MHVAVSLFNQKHISMCRTELKSNSKGLFRKYVQGDGVSQETKEFFGISSFFQENNGKFGRPF